MIGDIIAAELPALQAQAESLMLDTGVITRPGPLSDPDPETGVATPTHTPVYTGKARVKPYTRPSGGGVEAGEARDSLTLYTVSVPIRVVDVHPGDIFTATTAADGLVTGSPLRVVAVERGSQITARRMTCELVEAR